jgi:signal transduction histidine kinase
MPISLSLAVWLVTSVGVVLSIHGWMQLRAEEQDLLGTAKRELTLLTTAIRGAAESAIRDHQEPDISALLKQLETKDPAVDIFMFDADGRLLGSSSGSTSYLSTARNLAGAVAPDALAIEELGSHALAAIAPLSVGTSVNGRIVILRPRTALEMDLAAERRALILSIGLVVTVLSSVIWVVVRIRVHRPLRRVIDGVQRIRAGDLSARVNMPGANELAELAREFDAMTEALEAAHHRLAKEAETRERLEADIQRANRLATVGEVAATLAHEIGSPLQVLNGRSRDLTVRSDLPEDAKRSAAILVEQTDRIHHIVEQLLDVARRKAPKVVELDVRESVEQVLELLSTQARRIGVRFAVEAPDAPRLQGDPAQVQQVLLNLLQNAMRTTSRGGLVQITIALSSFERPSDSRPQASVAITVDDTGSGIPAAIEDRIFEPFFTAWNGESESKGTGLGLAVVRSIVTAHGGFVTTATPPSGVGARFVVHFPIQAAPLAQEVS